MDATEDSANVPDDRRVVKSNLLAISIALIVAGCPSLALAADWVRVPGTILDGVETYLDRDTIVENQWRVRAWLKMVEKGRDIAKSLEIFDCQARTYAFVSGVMYGQDGIPHDAFDVPDSALKWKHVAPETQAENDFLFACTLLHPVN